jgi:biofilm PGA synthesis lipoprotein PgaB
MRAVLLLLVALIVSSPALAQPAGQRFVSVAFHDVVDRAEQLESDGVTTDRLLRFFDWLKGSGWKVISLDDVAAAGKGIRPLPDKAILLTFDDGYASVYTRVFPLLLAYRYPAVIGLVGSWMDAPMDGSVLYGDRRVKRTRFLSWPQVKEMMESGLVEVGSHSFGLHTGVLANKQGNSIPAARTWRFDARTGRYETDAQHKARIRADLERARAQLLRETGRLPRALVWPFGRYSGPALEAAREAGFQFALSLEPEPADARRPFAIHRYFPTRDPGLGEIADNLRFLAPLPATTRVACVSLDPLAAAPTRAAQDAVLGHLVEAVRSIGANTVVVDAAPLSGDKEALGPVYFRSSLRPLAADLLSRAVWQIRSRGDADVFVRLPLKATVDAVGETGLARLYADMMRAVPADGIAIEAPGAATPQPGQSSTPWAARAERARGAAAGLDAGQALALKAARTAAVVDPRLRLMLVAPDAAPAGPPAFADLFLLPPVGDADASGALARQLRTAGWLHPALAGRVALSIPATDGGKALRAAQQVGAAGFALCPDALQPTDGSPHAPALASAELKAAFSAATFPFKP